MWLNLQTCLVLAFAINLSSAELPVPGLENFLKVSLLNYKRWVYFVGLDPSETIPFDIDQNFDCEGGPCEYTDVIRVTNYFLTDWHQDVADVEIQTNQTHFSIWHEIPYYALKGTYIVEEIKNGSHFKSSEELYLYCKDGFVSLTCTNVGLTTAGFLDLSSASFTTLSNIGNPDDCFYQPGGYGNFYKILMEGDLNPLPYYLKLYLEELFKVHPKNAITNATLPPNFTNSMKGIENFEYGIKAISSHPGVPTQLIPGWKRPSSHDPVLPTVVAKSKNLTVPGLKNFLKISMLKYAEWLVRKGMDPSERNYKNILTPSGNITSFWIVGHSNIKNIDVHATATGFSIYINLNTYTNEGTYSTDNDSGSFKRDCMEGYVFIGCKNIQFRSGYIDLSSAFIRTASSHPWTCYDIFDNTTRWISTPGMDTYRKRVTQDGLSDLPGYLKMYLEELFKTTPVDVIAKTTLNSTSNQTEIATKNNLNSASEVSKTGRGALCPVCSYCLISAFFILSCYF